MPRHRSTQPAIGVQRTVALLAALLLALPVGAQQSPTDTTRRDTTARPAPAATQQPARPRPWYERLSLRGYAQIRYNRLLESNEQLGCQQCRSEERRVGK